MFNWNNPNWRNESVLANPMDTNVQIGQWGALPQNTQLQQVQGLNQLSLQQPYQLNQQHGLQQQAPAGMGVPLSSGEHSVLSNYANNIQPNQGVAPSMWGSFKQGVGNLTGSFNDRVVDGKVIKGWGAPAASMAQVGLNLWQGLENRDLAKKQFELQSDTLAYNKMAGERAYEDYKRDRKNVGSAIVGGA